MEATIAKRSVGFCQEGMCYKDAVTITSQHAYSLGALVKYFKQMIEQAEIPIIPGRSDELTIGYCDELLKDLSDE